MITLGGNAELELVDSMDPFSEGIQFSVMPPKKSWKNISNLSGGEKVCHGWIDSPLCLRYEFADLEFSCSGVCASCFQGNAERNFPYFLSNRLLQPTPLYFMDEIDAALDFRNVSIIANYIKSKTEAAQL
jgi:structural maintenance of chromosome 4